MSEDGPSTEKPLSVPHRLLSRKRITKRTSIAQQHCISGSRVSKSTSIPRRLSLPNVPVFPQIMSPKKVTSTSWKVSQTTPPILTTTHNQHKQPFSFYRFLKNITLPMSINPN